MHGTPACFLAETSGGAVRSAEGTDGHGSWAGALRSSVGLENCRCRERRRYLGWPICGGLGWTLVRCFSVDPGCSTVPVSPHGSLAMEGTFCPRDPWNVAFEHECQFSVSSALPETHTSTMDFVLCRRAGRFVGGGVCHGIVARALRGNRYFKEGRESVCACREAGRIGLRRR